MVSFFLKKKKKLTYVTKNNTNIYPKKKKSWQIDSKLKGPQIYSVYKTK